MSRSIEPVVPAPLCARLTVDPGDPSVDGFTLLLLTPRDDGWPHQAMLSVGEVACVPGDPRRVKLAVWPGSTSTKNLEASRRATLTAIVEGVSYALFLVVENKSELTTEHGTLTRFDARIEAATADEAPYARLRDGIRFELNDAPATLARWRAVRAALESEALP
jgi:hypothetical protein